MEEQPRLEGASREEVIGRLAVVAERYQKLQEQRERDEELRQLHERTEDAWRRLDDARRGRDTDTGLPDQIH